MYPGTMAMKQAAKSPAPCDQSSLVSRYVEIAVSPEKSGARKTHTSLLGDFSIQTVFYGNRLTLPDILQGDQS